MADYRLIANGSRIYRYGSHLLRTPLRKTINITPDAMAYYSVAGTYLNATPTGGVIGTGGQNAYENAIRAGKQMRRQYLGLTTTPGRQIWRSVTTSHQPELVFYQGAYSTTTGNYNQSEAYLQIPAYHFTVPQKFADFAVTGGSLKIAHGGTVLQHQSVKTITTVGAYMPRFAVDVTDSGVLAAGNPWRGDWTQDICVFGSVDTDPVRMVALATQSVSLNTSRSYGSLNGGESANGIKIWDNTFVSYNDGFVPRTDSPWTQQITLTPAMLSAVSRIGGGWVVPRPNVGVSSSDSTDTANDYPFYYPSSNSPGWWICCTFWGFSITVTLEI